MRVLIACEESQAVCIAFRNIGIEAYSCDIQECSGGHPEWHIKGDAIKEAYSGKYDLMIAHPPCTDLAVSGASHFEQKRMDGRQQQSIVFFMKLVNAPIRHIAVENPVCIMSSIYRKPDQIIHPYYFGDNVPKKTCLWLKNLPKLFYQLENDLFGIKTSVDPEYAIYNSKKTISGKSKYSVLGTLGTGHGKERSKTFQGVATAIAEQWGAYLLSTKQNSMNLPEIATNFNFYNQ